MKKYFFDEGWSTLNFIISLLVVCLLVVAFGLFTRTLGLNIEKDKIRREKEIVVDAVINEVFAALKEDNSPSADSKHDSFFSYDNAVINDCHVSIIPLSGKININFFPFDVLCGSELRNLIKEPNSFTYFVNESEVLFNTYSQISDYMEETTFDEYFTLYGWASYNISSEESIRKLLQLLKINSGLFLTKRNSLLSSKQYVKSYSDLRSVSGVNYKDIIPYINIEAPLNVNFIDEQILIDILMYPKYRISGINQKVSSIVSLRESKEIDSEKLQSILAIRQDNELFYLLGVDSWFYRINFEYDDVFCSVVVAKEVSDDISKNKKHKWFILEKCWK